MYIYNVTINVGSSIHKEWLSWIENHIKEVLETGLFLSAKQTRVLVQEEMGGVTYSIQYTAKSRESLDQYYKIHAPRLRNDSLRKFSDKIVSFRTELKVIKEFFPKNNSH